MSDRRPSKQKDSPCPECGRYADWDECPVHGEPRSAGQMWVENDMTTEELVRWLVGCAVNGDSIDVVASEIIAALHSPFAVRRGVESGTIEGSVVDHEYGKLIVIPVSDGGSET